MTATVLPEKSLIGAASAPPPGIVRPCFRRSPAYGSREFRATAIAVGDRAFLKRGEIGAIEVGFDLIVRHARKQHLACGSCVERRANTEIGHPPHRVQTFDKIDVHA